MLTQKQNVSALDDRHKDYTANGSLKGLLDEKEFGMSASKLTNRKSSASHCTFQADEPAEQYKESWMTG